MGLIPEVRWSDGPLAKTMIVIALAIAALMLLPLVAAFV